MTDISYHRLESKVSDKDLLSDEVVEKIINTLDHPYQERLIRHMMAAERKAFNDGRKEGAAPYMDL